MYESSPRQAKQRSLAPTIVSRFLADRSGETAVEYGLIASLVVVAILTALSQFSTATNKMYAKISNAMSGTP